jgi:hypothetical protein
LNVISWSSRTIAPCDEAGDVAPDDADDGAAQTDDQEGGEPLENVGVVDIFLSNVHVGVEHVVQDLEVKDPPQNCSNGSKNLD